MELSTHKEQLTIEKEKFKEVKNKNKELEKEVLSLKQEKTSLTSELKEKEEFEKKNKYANVGFEAMQNEKWIIFPLIVYWNSSKLQTEISKLNRNNLLLQEEMNKRDLTIEEVKDYSQIILTVI